MPLAASFRGRRPAAAVSRMTGLPSAVVTTASMAIVGAAETLAPTRLSRWGPPRRRGMSSVTVVASSRRRGWLGAAALRRRGCVTHVRRKGRPVVAASETSGEGGDGQLPQGAGTPSPFSWPWTAVERPTEPPAEAAEEPSAPSSSTEAVNGGDVLAAATATDIDGDAWWRWVACWSTTPQGNLPSGPGHAAAPLPPLPSPITDARTRRAMAALVVIAADVACDLIVLDVAGRIRSVPDALAAASGVVAAAVAADALSGLLAWAAVNYGGPGGGGPGRPAMRALWGWWITATPGGGTAEPTAPGVEASGATPEGVPPASPPPPADDNNFFSTIAGSTAAVTPFLLILKAYPPAALALHTFSVYTATFVSLLPAVVKWTAMPSPPAAVRALQRWGLLSRRPPPDAVVAAAVRSAVAATGTASATPSSPPPVCVSCRAGPAKGRPRPHPRPRSPPPALPCTCRPPAGSPAVPTTVGVGGHPPHSHRSVTTGGYCGFSGVCNRVLDGTAAFRRLERALFVASRGALVPRVWAIHPGARVAACGPDGARCRLPPPPTGAATAAGEQAPPPMPQPTQPSTQPATPPVGEEGGGRSE